MAAKCRLARPVAGERSGYRRSHDATSGFQRILSELHRWATTLTIKHHRAKPRSQLLRPGLPSDLEALY